MEPSKEPLKPEQPTQPTLEQPKLEQPKLEQPKLEQSTLASPTTQNAIKLAGEALLPGASLLMEGKILHGGLHLLAGAVAKVFLGPVGLAVVIANSYSSSTTGKNLLEQFSSRVPPKTE